MLIVELLAVRNVKLLLCSRWDWLAGKTLISAPVSIKKNCWVFCRAKSRRRCAGPFSWAVFTDWPRSFPVAENCRAPCICWPVYQINCDTNNTLCCCHVALLWGQDVVGLWVHAICCPTSCKFQPVQNSFPPFWLLRHLLAPGLPPGGLVSLPWHPPFRPNSADSSCGAWPKLYEYWGATYLERVAGKWGWHLPPRLYPLTVSTCDKTVEMASCHQGLPGEGVVEAVGQTHFLKASLIAVYGFSGGDNDISHFWGVLGWQNPNNMSKFLCLTADVLSRKESLGLSEPKFGIWRPEFREFQKNSCYGRGWSLRWWGICHFGVGVTNIVTQSKRSKLFFSLLYSSEQKLTQYPQQFKDPRPSRG